MNTKVVLSSIEEKLYVPDNRFSVSLMLSLCKLRLANW